MGNNNSLASSIKSARLSNLTAVTSSNPSAVENKEDVTLIWLDKSIDTSRTVLREITNYVRLYTEFEPCLTYIRSISTERIFLIISGSFVNTCLPQIHDFNQVDSIFIFCINSSKYQHQSNEYPKIVGIFDDERQLIESVRQELTDLQKQLATFSLYKNQKSTRDLLEESASFLWFQLFKDILLQMPRSEKAKEEMIDQCKRFYRGNTEELQLIEEFEQTYTKSDTIRWYTRQCFIYRLCNKALRTEDIELLYLFRYYIQDLCKRLASEHEQFRLEHVQQPIVKLYRGLKLTKGEIEKYRTNIGSLISTNGFLSTSRNSDLAVAFALKSSKRSVDVLPTLFVIEADVRLDHAVFADISSLSVYPEEEEILFDIGCAFKISEVSFDQTRNLWIIQMKLTNEGRQIVETYIEANRREMEKGNLFLIFGLLLTEMGQYDHAQVYFENLLSSNTVDDRASIYTNIGRVKHLKGLYDQALENFQIVYDLQRKQNSTSELDFARTMNNLGLVYMEQKKYDLAFDYLFQVINIYDKHPEADRLLIASAHNAIGVVYSARFHYSQALKYLFSAMKIYEEYLPTIDHPLMAVNYNSIGLVHYYMKEYQQSFEYCSKAYRIREKVLPVHHPNLADSCNNLALIYQQLHQYKQAEDYFQRAIRIYETNPDKKMNIPICWNNIGLLFVEQKNVDRAIGFYFKALDYYQNSKKYQEEIAYTFDNLGTAFEMKSEFDQALKYYKQSLEYQEKNPAKLVQIAMKIGNIYQNNGKYDQALEYYLKALDKTDPNPPELLLALGLIYHRQNQYQTALDYYKRTLDIRKQLSSNEDLHLAWIYNNLGCVYDDLGDSKRALKYQQKAFDIRKKFLPSTHPDLAVSLTNLGRIHHALAYQTDRNPQEFNQALDNYKSAYHIRRKSLPNNHPDLALSYFNLALIHFDQREYEQCYAEIQKTLNIQKSNLPVNHSDLQQTLKLEAQVKQMLDYQKK